MDGGMDDQGDTIIERTAYKNVSKSSFLSNAEDASFPQSPWPEFNVWQHLHMFNEDAAIWLADGFHRIYFGSVGL